MWASTEGEEQNTKADRAAASLAAIAAFPLLCCNAGSRTVCAFTALLLLMPLLLIVIAVSSLVFALPHLTVRFLYEGIWSTLSVLVAR